MKNQGIKQLLIVELISQGFDFNLSPFRLTYSQKNILADYAKQIGYRKPKNSYFCLGGCFFEHLQKIYLKDRLLHEKF